MTLTPPTRREKPLHVGIMALALLVAAFVGAGLGLAWQAFSASDAPQQSAPAEEEAG